MQPTQKLTTVLRDLLAIIDDEANRNPEFASKLEAVMAQLPSRPARPPRLPKPTVVVPDVFAELQAKGELEFGFWMRSLDIPTLKAIIKKNGFDPAKAAQRWTDPDKFIGLVIEQTLARLKRGSSFLTPKSGNQTPDK